MYTSCSSSYVVACCAALYRTFHTVYTKWLATGLNGTGETRMHCTYIYPVKYPEYKSPEIILARGLRTLLVKESHTETAWETPHTQETAGKRTPRQEADIKYAKTLPPNVL